MTFIKYTKDGKAVIQHAALILSGLYGEDVLNVLTLDKALVLMKREMTPAEKYRAYVSLSRLASDLQKELTSGKPDGADSIKGRNAWGYNASDGVITFPIEAFEDAGIWGEDLLIQSVDGAVVIIPEKQVERMTDRAMTAISKGCLDTAVIASLMGRLKKQGGDND